MSGWTRLAVSEAPDFEEVIKDYNGVTATTFDDGSAEAVLHGYFGQGDAFDLANDSGALDAIVVSANNTSDSAEAWHLSRSNRDTELDIQEYREVGERGRYGFTIEAAGLYLNGDTPDSSEPFLNANL